MGNSTNLKRFYLLDILRFFAAFAVLIWHYQHFYYVAPETLPSAFVRSEQPLYGLFGPFYEYGYRAVQLFWILSGFVFFQTYLKNVENKKLNGVKFFVNRFSRLYPLHIVTLVFVAILQIFAFFVFSENYIYGHNDLKHFVLNLFLATGWGLEDGQSFNDPIWSVSIEVVAYLAFFVFARLGFHSLWQTLWALFLSVVAWFFLGAVGLGLTCFFLGGVIWWAVNFWRRLPKRLGIETISIVAVGTVSTLILVCLLQRQTLISVWSVFVFAPSLIFLLACWQLWSPEAGRKWAWSGDLTYASYLIHVPIQLSVLIIARLLVVEIHPSSAAFFLLYMLGILILSWFVFVWFEKPAQTFLRNRFLPPK